MALGLRGGLRAMGKAASRRLPEPVTEAVRTWAFAFPAHEVVRVTDALEAAGVHSFLLGGWGVDALAGRQTRRHADLDVAFEATPGSARTAAGVLLALGYDAVESRHEDTRFMPARLVARHTNGRSVDLVAVRPSGPRSPAGPSPTELPADLARLADGVEEAAGDWSELEAGGPVLTVGQVGGREVRCLTAGAHRRLHEGYELRRRDRRDLALLAPEQRHHRVGVALALVVGRVAGAPTAVVVVVPEADPALAAARHAAGCPPDQPAPAHVTVLYPFLPARLVGPRTRARLRRLAAQTQPFSFQLGRVAEFPGVSYLEPQPSEPFAQLTRRIWGAWPGHPPFSGDFEEIVPHLTLVEGAHDPDAVRRRVDRALPIDATAAALDLVVPAGASGWQVLDRFPFAEFDPN